MEGKPVGDRDEGLRRLQERIPRRFHISVVIPYDILKTKLGKACLNLTDTISATDARILACDCGIIPTVLNSKSDHSTWGE